MADRRESTTSTSQASLLPSKVDPTSARFEANMRFMADLVSQMRNEEEKIREGGGPKAIENQHSKRRLTARERIILLADSAGVFLPLQEDVFPATDDFGRVFRNNAVMSAMGIPQIATIMGMCVAGGGYLPVMCDNVLMTDGSGP